MQFFKPLVLSLLTFAVSGCGQTQFVSRDQTPDLATIQTGNQEERVLAEQAVALDQMTKDLVRQATLKGAAIGAAAGCGLAMVSATESGKCLVGAVAGGAIGAVAGNAMGKREVEKRVEIVSLSRVTPSIAHSQKQMAMVSDGLSSMLTAQKAEMADLEAQRTEGRITQAQYEARIAEIRDARASMTESLTLSARQAEQALDAMKAAKAQGQTGLDWHIMQVETLEDEAISARSRISLL